jgi:hypothetical protein
MESLRLTTFPRRQVIRDDRENGRVVAAMHAWQHVNRKSSGAGLNRDLCRPGRMTLLQLSWSFLNVHT